MRIASFYFIEEDIKEAKHHAVNGRFVYSVVSLAACTDTKLNWHGTAEEI